MNQQILTKQELKNKVPSIYGKKPLSYLSDKYTHINSEKIVDYFGELGWHPVSAFQQKLKSNSTKRTIDTQIHTIRFANPSYEPLMKQKGDLIPNLVLKNSHNGSSKLWLSAGIFRVVCSNGLVVADKMFGELFRKHTGNKEEIFEAVYKVERNFDTVWNKVDEYASIQLSKKQIVSFAIKAIELNWGNNSLVTPQDVLKVRRKEDENETLWSTFNILQENIMKGGISYISNNQKEKQTKEVNGLKSVGFNMNLWMLMEAFRLNKKFN